VLMIGGLGAWLQWNSGFTAYAWPGDPVIAQFHASKWYVLRVEEREDSSHALVRHTGRPYTTLKGCEAAVPAVAAGDREHQYRCGAYIARFY